MVKSSGSHQALTSMQEVVVEHRAAVGRQVGRIGAVEVERDAARVGIPPLVHGHRACRPG